MKFHSKFLYCMVLVFLLTACGEIPTLPPLDSTITIYTPQATEFDLEITATERSIVATLPAATFTPNFQPSQTPLPRKTSTKIPIPDTATPKPSATVKPSKTPTLKPPNTATFTPEATNTPTATITSTTVPYVLQQMNPFYLENFTHPEKGCDWMGVAGQVFDKNGQVQTEVVIKAGGTIGGKAVIEDMTLPLAEPDIDLAYGPAGYEITLSNEVMATNSEAWIQLFSLTGDPLSERVMLITYDDCLKNLILMNFSQK
jgi:hypothetical protein